MDSSEAQDILQTLDTGLEQPSDDSSDRVINVLNAGRTTNGRPREFFLNAGNTENIPALELSYSPERAQSRSDVWELQELLAVSAMPSKVIGSVLVVFLPLSGKKIDGCTDIATSPDGKVAIPLRNCKDLMRVMQTIAEDGLKLHSRVLTPSESDLIQAELSIRERNALLTFGREIISEADLETLLPSAMLELLANLIAVDIPARIVKNCLFVMPDAGTPAETIGLPLYSLPGNVYHIPAHSLQRFQTVIERASQQFDAAMGMPFASQRSDAAWRQLCQTIYSSVDLLGEPVFRGPPDPTKTIATDILVGAPDLAPERRVLRNILNNITGQAMAVDSKDNLIVYTQLKKLSLHGERFPVSENGMWLLTPEQLLKMEASVKAMYVDIVGNRDRNEMSFPERSTANERMKISRTHITSLIGRFGKAVPTTELPISMRHHLETMEALREELKKRRQSD